MLNEFMSLEVLGPILLMFLLLACDIFGWKHFFSMVFTTSLVFAGVFTWKLLEKYREIFGSYLPAALSPSRADFGVMGDFFGGVLNPFFSFLGLMMLLYTLFQNQKELELSRKELNESSKALKEQSETLKKQRFEDTFFSLLDQFNGVSDKLNTIIAPRAISGTVVGNLLTEVVEGGKGYSCYPPLLKNSKEKLLKYNPLINQYFRVLYQMLKLIAVKCPESSHNSALALEKISDTAASSEEKFYSNLIRSFISDDMYLFLAINCYAEDEKDSFYGYRLLVERYEFLEHLNINNNEKYGICLLQLIVLNYRKLAFGKNSNYDECLSKAKKVLVVISIKEM